MVVKLVRTKARADGFLMVDGSNETIADAYLSKGWTILGVLQGATPNDVSFVVRQDGIAATAEMIEDAEVIDTSALRDLR
jgi:hypothetical protein